MYRLKYIGIKSPLGLASHCLSYWVSASASKKYRTCVKLSRIRSTPRSIDLDKAYFFPVL